MRNKNVDEDLLI